MFKNSVLILGLIVSLLLTLVTHAQDRESLQDIPLQAAGVWENNLYVFGPLDAVNITTNGRGNIRDIVWHDNILAFTQYDVNWVINIWVSIDMQEPFMLVNNVDSMYPISFTPDGLLLYALPNPNNTQPGYNYVVDLFTIAPDIGAVAMRYGSFGDDVIVGVGCGGGSPLPTDWQRYTEVGFGGQRLVLQVTEQGLLHSLDCAGVRTGLMDLATGKDIELGTMFGIAALSPDGTQLAGVQRDPNYMDPPELSTVNLITQEAKSYETVAIPDQVTWSADGAALYYSVYQALDTMIPVTDAERATLSKWFPTDTGEPNMSFPLYAISIRRYNLATGHDELVYEAPEDVFSIGRMVALPDKDVLVFSQIPNLQNWIAAITSGEITINSPENVQLATVPVSILALNLQTGHLTTVNKGVNLYTPNL